MIMNRNKFNVNNWIRNISKLTLLILYAQASALWAQNTPELVKDINPLNASSSPGAMTNVNGTTFFRASDNTYGLELWKTDGTEAGTTLVKDIYAGLAPGSPSPLINFNGKLLFGARDDTHGRELWKTDGTESGTVLVKDIRIGSEGSGPRNMINFNGNVFFSAYTPATGEELWKTDGTEAGTTLVKDIFPGAGGSQPSLLTNVNGTLFFRALTRHGLALWKSDGTESGTVLVKNTFAGVDGEGGIRFLTNVNGKLLFSGYDDTTGYELWKSDGSEAGTTIVKDIVPGRISSGLASLINIYGTLYFRASNGIDGYELWKSDGTEAGTILVKDITLGGGSSWPDHLTNVNGMIFFSVRSNTHEISLWKSDGTEGGTVLVKNTFPGSANQSLSGLVSANGKLYFSAVHPTYGRELWMSDGTESGTTVVGDIAKGEASSTPYFITNTGNAILFGADDGVTGRELWKVENNTGIEINSFTGDLLPISIGSVANVYATYNVQDSSGAITATWDWGDGHTSEYAGSKGEVSGSHIYNQPGVYTVRLMLSNSYGESVNATYQYIPVYEPSAGFVTGGGWFNSPPGAYHADKSLTGKASFGFVSKYKKGARKPKGDTEFQFETANLYFNSSKFDWLVIAGATTKFKGVGTINGQGNYGFMITAIDSDISSNVSNDQIRIKIWNKDDEDTIVYDNQKGDGNETVPTTELGGGSIIIHKAK